MSKQSEMFELIADAAATLLVDAQTSRGARTILREMTRPRSPVELARRWAEHLRTVHDAVGGNEEFDAELAGAQMVLGWEEGGPPEKQLELAELMAEAFPDHPWGKLVAVYRTMATR